MSGGSKVHSYSYQDGNWRESILAPRLEIADETPNPKGMVLGWNEVRWVGMDLWRELAGDFALG
jgi:hypothetical protein